jgi:hypothetical protein
MKLQASFAEVCSSTHDRGLLVVHALWLSLQGSRQNRGEARRLFPSDIPWSWFRRSNGTLTLSHKYQGPFDHVDVDL